MKTTVSPSSDGSFSVIIKKFSALIDKLNTPTFLMSYPDARYPESLLPYPKVVIKKELQAALQVAKAADMQFWKLQLERYLYYIDRFVS